MQRSFQPVLTTIVLTAAMLLACVPVSVGLVLADGATHNLDYAVNDSVNVNNSTTANLLDGGEITDSLSANESSTLNVYGGSFGEDTYVTDNSTVNFYGGTLARYLMTSGSTTVNVYGGTFEGGLSALTESTVNVFGGSFGDGDLQVRSTLHIFGTDFNLAYGVYTRERVARRYATGRHTRRWYGL